MNKPFKYSLLFSVMAIFSITSPVRCMKNNQVDKAERDALAVALEQIEQMPGDFSKLKDRKLFVLTEMSVGEAIEGVEKDPTLKNLEVEGSFYAEMIANKLAKKYGKEVSTIDIVGPFLKLLEKTQHFQERARAIWVKILFPGDTTPKSQEEIQAEVQKRMKSEPMFLNQILMNNQEMRKLQMQIDSSSLDERKLITIRLQSKFEKNKGKIIILPLSLMGSKSITNVYLFVDSLPEKERPFVVVHFPICLEVEFEGMEKIKELSDVMLRWSLSKEQFAMVSLIRKLLNAKNKGLNQTDLFREGFVMVNTQRCLHEKGDRSKRVDSIKEILLNNEGASEDKIFADKVLEIGFDRETACSKQEIVSYAKTERAAVKAFKSLLSFS